MLVFIDESGDPGFRVTKGSSPFFVSSMVIFRDHAEADSTGAKIVALREKLGIRPEFKFNKCKNEFKDEFFQAVAGYRFSARFIVVNKARIYSPNLKADKESFYRFFIRMMMKYDGGALQDAKVVIDGSGDRPFKKQFRSYIRRNIAVAAVRQVELKDSVRDPLIQLADMVAGAVARSCHGDRKDGWRWRNMLRDNGQIENVWNFE
ncbi:MAG: DUF3800 domain-containing protein [Alphaproteobacteria bacterium]|nr:DUF3800 domain-containing protein [Alphaproteobacteria bacterium]